MLSIGTLGSHGGKLIAGVIVFALLSACVPTQRSRTAATLEEIESYINERPDSALAVLRALPPQSLCGPALRARAALLHSMALDKCYIDLQTDSILAPAVAWYARHGSPDEKLKALYYLGRTQYNAGDFRAAIVTYTEALDLTQTAADYKYIGLVNQAMADTYSASYQEGESYPYLERAYQAFIAVPDSSLAKLTLYKQALADVSQRRWEQAEKLYARLFLSPEGIEPFLPTIKSDYALSQIVKSRDNGPKALDTFEEALSYGVGLPSANHWAAYAYCLFSVGRYEQATGIFDQLERSFPSDKRIVFWRNEVEYRRGAYKTAYLLLQESLGFQDSVLNRALTQSTIAAQKDFFSYKANREKDRAQHRKDLLRMILLLFLMASFVVSLLIHQHIQKEKRDKARLLLLMDTIQRQSEETVQNKNQQYTSLFQDYFKTLGQICADYEEGRISAGNTSDKAIIRRIDRIAHDFVGNAESHQEFEEMLDKYLDHIMTDFRNDYPKLKHRDYQLASYVFSGIDMPTMSALMGIEVDVLYTRKSRLKAMVLKSSSLQKDRYLAFFR